MQEHIPKKWYNGTNCELWDMKKFVKMGGGAGRWLTESLLVAQYSFYDVVEQG
jgi:hypothetical protein